MLRRWVTPGVFVTLAAIGVACESLANCHPESWPTG